MRIRDWSPDVCSSDLGAFHTRGGHLPCPEQADGLPEVFFRAEDAVLVPAEQSSLLGTVAHVQFLGERTRVYLNDVTPGRTVCVETSNRNDFQPGQQVGVRIAPEHLLLINGD